MHTHLFSKLGVAGIITTLRTSSIVLLACLFASVSGTAIATPLPPLLPGYNDDVGTNYFVPNQLLVGIEVIDPFEPFTSFGFFYQSNPGTTISIFDADDLSNGIASSQVSLVDFDTGLIYDIDVAPPPGPAESSFTPLLGDIGFFLNIGGTTIYSDPSLNGDIDLFSAWQNEVDPTLWGLAFEGINADGTQALLNLSLVGGVSAAVPEPSIMLLLALGGPIVLVASRRRRNQA